MTNEEKLAKLLGEVGVSASFQKAWLEATDETEAEVLEDIEAEVLKVTRATKLKDLKSKDEIAVDFKVYKSGIRAKINKTLQMGMNRGETDALTDDEFMKKVDEFYSGKVSELSTLTDEKVKEQINALKQETIQLKEKLDVTTSDFETKIETVKSEYEEKLHADQIQKVLIAETSKVRYASTEFEELFKRDTQDYILNNYKVLPDGTLQAKDGTVAIHPNGKASVSKVSEIVEYYVAHKGYEQKSNGEPISPKNPIVGQVIKAEGLTGRAKEMAERANIKI